VVGKGKVGTEGILPGTKGRGGTTGYTQVRVRRAGGGGGGGGGRSQNKRKTAGTLRVEKEKNDAWNKRVRVSGGSKYPCSNGKLKGRVDNSKVERRIAGGTKKTRGDKFITS